MDIRVPTFQRTSRFVEEVTKITSYLTSYFHLSESTGVSGCSWLDTLTTCNKTFLFCKWLLPLSNNWKLIYTIISFKPLVHLWLIVRLFYLVFLCPIKVLYVNGLIGVLNKSIEVKVIFFNRGKRRGFKFVTFSHIFYSTIKLYTTRNNISHTIL